MSNMITEEKPITEATSESIVAVGEPSHSDLLERARKITSHAQQRADLTDRERKIPDETIKEFFDAGLMRVVQPRKWGGLGRSVSEFYELIYELSHGCASTGWIYGVLAGHSMVVATFSDEAQSAVWGENAEAVVSSAFAPTLQAKKLKDGYEVSGRCPFSSGADHASWALLGGLVSNEEGGPRKKLFLVPRTEYRIIDDWFVMGLSGTGSKTLEVIGSFVPENRVIDLQDFFGGLAPLGLQSVIVGAAKGAVDCFVQTIRNNPGKFGGRPPADSELIQVIIGNSIGDVNYSWEILQRLIFECETMLMSGKEISEQQVIRNRSATALISRLCLGAIERMFELSGGQGIYNTQLSRAFRDVRAGVNHAALNATLAAKDAGVLALKAS